MTTPRQIPYFGQYVSNDVVHQCFRHGELLHVDKVLCGNGFSTAFLSLPVPQDKVNVLIAPNKGVVQGKEREYREGKLGSQRMQFIYEKCTDTLNLNTAQIVVIVSDSVKHRQATFYAHADRMNFVLLDEYHGFGSGAIFRKALENFTDRLKPLLTAGAAIATVTASPNMFAEIDIQVVGTRPPRTIWSIRHDMRATIAEIIKLLNAGEEVVLFTQNATIPATIAKDGKRSREQKPLRANILAADSFRRTLAKYHEIQEDENALLTIGTSTAFEGVDFYHENAHVFFFEDRASKHNTFTLSQIYQATNRTRKGAASITICQVLSDNVKRTAPTAERVLHHIESTTDKSKVLSGKGADFKRYIKEKATATTIEHTPINAIISHDLAAKVLDNGLVWLSKNNATTRKFLEDRNIVLNEIDERQIRLGALKIKLEAQATYLKANEAFIRKHNLCGDELRIYVTISTNEDLARKEALKRITIYLLEKNYAGDYVRKPYEQTAMDILSDENRFNKLCERLKADKLKRKNADLNNNIDGKAKEQLDAFNTNVKRYTAAMILYFAQHVVSLPPRFVVNRDYNLSVSFGMPELRTLAAELGRTLTEIDIKNAFPRIVYGCAGYVLPDSFYGSHDKGRAGRKIKVNVTLNSFRYDKNKATQPKAYYRGKSKVSLNRAGFHAEITEWLIDNFFEASNKGDLFNILAWHERQIITSLTASIETLGGNAGYFRRHDSLILVDNTADLENLLTKFTYLGQNG